MNEEIANAPYFSSNTANNLSAVISTVLPLMIKEATTVFEVSLDTAASINF